MFQVKGPLHQTATTLELCPVQAVFHLSLKSDSSGVWSASRLSCWCSSCEAKKSGWTPQSLLVALPAQTFMLAKDKATYLLFYIGTFNEIASCCDPKQQSTLGQRDDHDCDGGMKATGAWSELANFDSNPVPSRSEAATLYQIHFQSPGSSSNPPRARRHLGSILTIQLMLARESSVHQSSADTIFWNICLTASVWPLVPLASTREKGVNDMYFNPSIIESESVLLRARPRCDGGGSSVLFEPINNPWSWSQQNAWTDVEIKVVRS